MQGQNRNHSERRRQSIVMWIFLAAISYFLITEHWAHVVPFLPYALLLACPLMHLFMHGSHGDHSGHSRHRADDAEVDNEPRRRGGRDGSDLAGPKERGR